MDNDTVEDIFFSAQETLQKLEKQHAAGAITESEFNARKMAVSGTADMVSKAIASSSDKISQQNTIDDISKLSIHPSAKPTSQTPPTIFTALRTMVSNLLAPSFANASAQHFADQQRSTEEILKKTIICFLVDGSERYLPMTVRAINSLLATTPHISVGVLMPPKFETTGLKAALADPDRILYKEYNTHFHSWNPTQYKLDIGGFATDFDIVFWLDSDTYTYGDLADMIVRFAKTPTNVQCAFVKDHVCHDPSFRSHWRQTYGFDSFIPQACFMGFKSTILATVISAWQNVWREWIEPTPFANHPDPCPSLPQSAFCIEQYALGLALSRLGLNEHNITEIRRLLVPLPTQPYATPLNEATANAGAHHPPGSSSFIPAGGAATNASSSFPSSYYNAPSSMMIASGQSSYSELLAKGGSSYPVGPIPTGAANRLPSSYPMHSSYPAEQGAPDLGPAGGFASSYYPSSFPFSDLPSWVRVPIPFQQRPSSYPSSYPEENFPESLKERYPILASSFSSSFSLANLPPWMRVPIPSLFQSPSSYPSSYPFSQQKSQAPSSFPSSFPFEKLPTFMKAQISSSSYPSSMSSSLRSSYPSSFPSSYSSSTQPAKEFSLASSSFNSSLNSSFASSVEGAPFIEQSNTQAGQDSVLFDGLFADDLEGLVVHFYSRHYDQSFSRWWRYRADIVPQVLDHWTSIDKKDEKPEKKEDYDGL
eukprot:TRINITY_DN4326_c0_g1_i2.p1 TRINITY_DN4326_c0_g1~~TRINITY_DN4326_c0_g1_i2.p1  ORF type:complete len:708 (+),score=233.94 TRINITY_DN4326_c0_g1_i2:126-2249(+)